MPAAQRAAPSAKRPATSRGREVAIHRTDARECLVRSRQVVAASDADPPWRERDRNRVASPRAPPATITAASPAATAAATLGLDGGGRDACRGQYEPRHANRADAVDAQQHRDCHEAGYESAQQTRTLASLSRAGWQPRARLHCHFLLSTLSVASLYRRAGAVPSKITQSR
jgi:hypothetical protein